MVALAAAVLGLIAALVGLFNGLPTSYLLIRKVLSGKGENEAQRVQERRYEETQHTGPITKRATQSVTHFIKENSISAQNLNLILDKAVNVIVEGNSIHARNFNIIPCSTTLTENGNGNRSLMESVEVLCPITQENEIEEYKKQERKENVQKGNNGKPRNNWFCSLICNLFRKKQNVEERNNGKPQKTREEGKRGEKEYWKAPENQGIRETRVFYGSKHGWN